MSVNSIGMSLNMFFIRIPNVGMADGWSANLLVYLGWYIDLWVGWLEMMVF